MYMARTRVSEMTRALLRSLLQQGRDSCRSIMRRVFCDTPRAVRTCASYACWCERKQTSQCYLNVSNSCAARYCGGRSDL